MLLRDEVNVLGLGLGLVWGVLHSDGPDVL